MRFLTEAAFISPDGAQLGDFCIQTRSAERMLLLVIILPQAPQFSLVQSDVMVDLEVVQPVVLAVWVDLKGRGQGQSFREEAD